VIEPSLVILLILTIFDFVFGVILAVIAREFKTEGIYYTYEYIIP
jgi:hypothetical protein